MVRSVAQRRVSNHECAAILRDAAKTPLLGIRQFSLRLAPVPL
jgi:hypothetical protein